MTTEPLSDADLTRMDAGWCCTDANCDCLDDMEQLIATIKAARVDLRALGQENQRLRDALKEFRPPVCDSTLQIISAVDSGSGTLSSTFEHASTCRKCRIDALLEVTRIKR